MTDKEIEAGIKMACECDCAPPSTGWAVDPLPIIRDNIWRIKRRAEVAERALLRLCEETMRDKLIIMYPIVGRQVRDKQELYDYCIEKAERELAEEGKDG